MPQSKLTPQTLRVWTILLSLSPSDLQLQPQTAVAERLGITRSSVNRHVGRLISERAVRRGRGNGLIPVRPNHGSRLYRALHSAGPVGIVS